MHNQLRASEPAADMQELVWDDRLAALAHGHVQRCDAWHRSGEKFTLNINRSFISFFNRCGLNHLFGHFLQTFLFLLCQNFFMYSKNSEFRNHISKKKNLATTKILWNFSLYNLHYYIAQFSAYERRGHGYSYIGENIWWSNEAYLRHDLTGVIMDFYNEKPFYNYATMQCWRGAQCGHYTQVSVDYVSTSYVIIFLVLFRIIEFFLRILFLSFADTFLMGHCILIKNLLSSIKS